MAEFKLGRIRFVWKNNWATGTTYYKDDIVRNGGKTYVCVAGHIAAADFYTDLSHSPTRWNQVSDGSEWKGDWTTDEYYKVNDLVKYGGRLYLCNQAHTSNLSANSGTSPDITAGLEADFSKWDLYATSLDWKGNWTTSYRYKIDDVVRYGGISYVCNTGHQSSATATTDVDGLEQDLSKWDVYTTGFDWIGDWTTAHRYKKNDVVLYGGTTYICNTGHLSAATSTLGLEADQGLWDYFHKGIKFLGEWSGSSVRYKVNDIVKYGSDLWICTLDHTSAALFSDSTNWSLFVNGLQFENSWSDSAVYQPGDIVSYGGYAYISKTNHTNKVPTANLSDWDLFTTGFNFRGDWSSIEDYKVGDVIRLNGYTYVALLDHSADNITIPPNLTYWSKLNSGIKWAATSQLFANVAGTNIVGSGTGATFDITLSNTGYTAVVHTGAAGSNYVTNDTIKITGDKVGGITPANDIILTVIASAGAVQTATTSGIAVTWASGTNYVLGDAVLFGVNSYICVLAHTGSALSRPDVDTTGTYWNLLAQGSITSVLTTQGDTIYYGGSGPTRLPIGTDGQVLRVTGDKPSWEYFGVINNVVYVANSGVDVTGNGQGLTIDKPWKSIRFAAQQIEDGYLNPNATELIKKNKQFLIKEVNHFVQYTYKAIISEASTTVFTANSTVGLYVGMPIVFTGTVGGVVAGTTYYVYDIVGNTFGISNTSATPTRRPLTAESGSMTGSYAFVPSKSEKDAGILVDAIAYDISHSGTYQTTQTALAYFTSAGNAYIPGVYAYDITAFVGALNYLSTLIGYVVENAAPANNYQTLNGVTLENQAIQVIDVSLTLETNIATTVANLVSIVTTGLAAGTTSAIPAVVNPGTTISVKTGTYTEILPIVVPRNTAVVGDELRSSVVQPATANANLVNDKPKTISVLNRVKAIIPDLLANITVTPTTGNTAPQAYINGVATTSTAGTSIAANTSTINTILAGGLAAVPSATITDPTSYDTGYYNARRLIVANKQFLKDEIIAYVNYNFVNFNSHYNSTTCARDVGLIIDAVCYDLITGSNFASSVAGEAYYRIQSANVTSSQMLQTLDVINYAADLAATYVNGTVLAQVQEAFANVYNILENGLSAVPAYIWPSNGSTTTATITDAAALQTNRATMITGIETYLSNTAPYSTVWSGLSTDQKNTCKRDVGYIIDAVTYDLQYGGTYQSVTAGSAYYSFGTLEIAAGEKAASVAAVTQLATLMKAYTSPSGDTTVDTLTGIISGIIDTGTIPSATYPSITGETTAKQTSFTGLQGAKSTISSSVTSYITTTYSSLTYNTTSCARDIGYIVDALQYDLTYGGNLETVVAARSYYTNSAFVEPSVEKKAALAAQLRLKLIINDVAQGIAITPTSGNSTSQTTSGTAGSPAAAAFAQARIQEIYNTINSGYEPTTILPSTSWVDSSLVAASNVIQARRSAIRSGAIAAINKTYPTLEYNTDTCSRDVGYIVDALCYDFMFNSNFRSIKAAMAYYRATSSAQVVVNDQLTQTEFVIDYIKTSLQHLVQSVTADTGNLSAASAILTSVSIINTLVSNGIASVPSFTFTNPTGYNTSFLQSYGDGKAQIVQNYQFIKDEISAWMALPANGYSSVWSAIGAGGQANCARDVGYILDALQYDMTYGGNTQTLIAGSSFYSNGTLVEYMTGEKAAAIAAYGRLQTIIGQIVQKQTVTPTSGNTTPQVTTGSVGANIADAASFAQSRVGEVISWITDGTAPSTIAPTAAIALASTELQNGYNALQSAKSEIQADTVGWVNKFYQGINFNSTICSRDAGIIVDALSYDLVFGTNFNSIKAGMSYHRATTSAQYVINNQLVAEIGAINFIGQKAKRIAAYGATAQVIANIDDMIAAITGTITTVATATAVNGNITVTSSAGMYVGMPVKFNATVGGIFSSKTYWIATIPNTTTITITDTYGSVSPLTLTAQSSLTVAVTAGGEHEYCGTTLYNNVLSTINGAEILRANKTFIANEATAWVRHTYAAAATATTASNGRVSTTATHNFVVGDPIVFTGTGFGNLTPNTTYYVLTVPTTTSFTLTAVQGSSTPVVLTDDTGVLTVHYAFNASACQRDMATYIDALIYDLNYLGNYKSLRAVQLYKNSVSGSALSDMFYLRNSTGLRNMTLTGLTGTLGAANTYGTQRPTAGAYASLDPGYGPTDNNVWISTRSPYVQNVTNFGTSCIGLKIDGALHTGGNRSIVANDFTQILSDGIGVWCTGHNSLTELVSVFTYYCYAGYLAEYGGKIRATNGNNSYGVYGSLAEGVDTYETPITATINNRYYEAQIANVVTDSTDKIYRFEFSNAGSKYNTATYSISGTGYNAEVVADEFRDNAVFETRVLTNGANYVSISNVAQAGNTTSITLAATDSAISAAYLGMRIQLTGGSGVGQAGYILKYNSGTKLATVAKESYFAPTVTAAGSNLLTVSAGSMADPVGTPTDGLYDQMPVMFTGTLLSGCTLTLQQTYYVVGSSITDTQFSVSNSPGGAAISVGTASSGGPMTVNALGWDHIVTGTPIVSALDLTTAYIIEPRVVFSTPGMSNTADTITSLQYSDIIYGDTNTTYNGVGSVGVSATGGSGTNATFTVTRTGVAYSIITNNTGVNYKLGDVLTIPGTALGGVSPTNDITVTVNNVNLSTGAIQNFVYDGTGSGGYFVAIVENSTATRISSTGTSFVAGGNMSSSTGWKKLAYGAGRWMALAPNSGGQVSYTTDPTSAWTAGGSLPSTSGSWNTIAYGATVFMTIASNATTTATSTNGATWTAAGNLPSPNNWQGLAYGNGIWVAIAYSSSKAAYSTNNGSSWTEVNLPDTGMWSSIAFGKGTFVVSEQGTKRVLYTKDGVNWIIAANALSVAQNWSSVKYGGGLFFMLDAAGSSRKIATSENGFTWRTRLLTDSQAWSCMAYGSPSSVPKWVVLPNSTTTLNCVTTGCTAQGRAKVSNGAISEIRIVEPGSGYATTPTVTLVDPNQTTAATWQVRTGIGAIANPTFTNRGLQYATATATVEGNGYADQFQSGYYINVAGLPSSPTPGSNVQIALNNDYYKLVQVTNYLGTNGGQSPYTARFQLSPALTAVNAPAHGAAVTMRLQYSQVRLTGHDFLSIGTGGVTTTNYPNTPLQLADASKQTVGNGGGRTFYTATDQDGNFTVGTLFSVQQATGVASINADAFNLAGLNSLTLGSVALGGTGATITQFSTDQYFSANSDNIVPTQKAIKAYISSQIGGGSSALNVNTLTAGVIYIAGNSMSTTTGVQINVSATMNFTGGINGLPVAMDFLLLG